MFDFVDEFGDVLFGFDFFKHADDCFVGSSVFGSVEGTCGHSDGGVDVDS